MLSVGVEGDNILGALTACVVDSRLRRGALAQIDHVPAQVARRVSLTRCDVSSFEPSSTTTIVGRVAECLDDGLNGLCFIVGGNDYPNRDRPVGHADK